MSTLNTCGTVIFCGHVCSVQADQSHICICPFKWAIDPGCGHLMTGSCSLPLSEELGKGCLVSCGRILDCGHLCKEACSSLCVCPNPNCEGTTSLANKLELIHVSPVGVETDQEADNNTASEVGIVTAGEASSRQPLRNLPPPPPEIEDDDEFPEMPSPVPTPPLSSTLSHVTEHEAVLFTSPTAGATNSIEKDDPQPQPSTSRSAVVASDHQNAELFWNDVIQPVPQSADKIPAPLMEQIRKLLPASFFDKTIKNPWHEFVVFTQCPNEHIFTPEKSCCPQCKCPPTGPNITILKEGVPMESNVDKNPAETELLQVLPILKDKLEDVWNLGFTKCSLGHYFPGTSPQCDICGELSPSFVDADE